MKVVEPIGPSQHKTSDSYVEHKPFQTWMISDLSLYQNDKSYLVESAVKHRDSFQVFMLREKHLLEDERYSLIKAIRETLKGPKLVLNWNGTDCIEDWPLDGIHLGVEVWKHPELLRKHLHRLEGVDLSLAIHSLEEWTLARDFGYTPKVCIVSPIFSTTCKHEAKPLGLNRARLLASEIRKDLPSCSVIAMGGIQRRSNLDLVMPNFDGAAIRSGWISEKMLTISK